MGILHEFQISLSELLLIYRAVIFLNIATICSFSLYVPAFCMRLSVTSSMSQWQNNGNSLLLLFFFFFLLQELLICHSKTKVKQRIYIYATPSHIKALEIGQN